MVVEEWSGGGGSGSSTPSTVNGGTVTREALGNLAQPTTTPTSIASVYSLVNTSFTIPGQNGQPATVYSSPLNNQSTLQTALPFMLDQLTTQSASRFPPVEHQHGFPDAPRGVAGLSPADVENRRPTARIPGGGSADPAFQTTAWLLTQAN